MFKITSWDPCFQARSKSSSYALLNRGTWSNPKWWWEYSHQKRPYVSITHHRFKQLKLSFGVTLGSSCSTVKFILFYNFVVHCTLLQYLWTILPVIGIHSSAQLSHLQPYCIFKCYCLFLCSFRKHSVFRLYYKIIFWLNICDAGLLWFYLSWS